VLRAQNVQKRFRPTDTRGKGNINLRSDYCALTGIQKKGTSQNIDIDRRHENIKPCVLCIRNVANKMRHGTCVTCVEKKNRREKLHYNRGPRGDHRSPHSRPEN